MSTQLEYAKKGVITKEIEQVAKSENIDLPNLMDLIKEGQVVIPKNKNHVVSPCGIGKGLKTKINANIGTSEICNNINIELDKLNTAIKYGADTIMDLSTGGDLHLILKTIIEKSTVPVGTVPIYAVATKYIRNNRDLSEITIDDILKEIEYQAQLGVDFMTLHCGVTKTSLSYLQKDPRVCGIVSRGGSILKTWILKNNKENPLYEHYDKILDICYEYDVTISLGDGLRPGACADASDRGQLAELLVLGELVERAREHNVQVMVEGPGHMPLDEIEANVKIMKKVTKNAPFYVLGPLVTDIAPGYDHIVGAIGGTIAAVAGADFLCYVTPAEHLTLPTVEDVKQGVIASKIAAHAANIVKGIKSEIERDYMVSKYRYELNWDEMFKYVIDPELARKRRYENKFIGEYCSICGSLCAYKTDKLVK
ncbi:MAG: phosphomethylpyrimidine synthase ThiC [Bacteroidales bacterium]|nr:phosphomethylpyrimidine synthase ThiC [Bacteroidales bacterium]